MDREYHRNYSRNYYHKRKLALIEMLGSKCAQCGETDSLQFDHIDPTTKIFPIGKSLNYKWSVVLEEAKKCQLLCEGCHLKKTSEDISDLRKRNQWNKLDEASAEEMRSLRAEGWTLQQLADKYQISTAHTSNVISGKYWAP